MTAPDREEVDTARQGLAAVLEAVDRGEVTATEAERAYIAGAVDVLARLDEPGTDDPNL